jgi:glycerate kinase
VLVAPDAFAGVLRATQVAGAIGRGLERAGLIPPDLCPLAGGGAGTIDAVLPVLGGEVVAVPGHGSFALLDDGGTALVEPAPAERGRALLGAAVEAGAAVIIVAAAGLRDVTLHPGDLGGAKLVVLADGATPPVPGATLQAGAPWVLDVLGFDARMRAARAVVTGEHTLDWGTLGSRPVGEVGQRTRQAGVPLHAVVGRAELDRFDRRMIDLQRVFEAVTLEELEAAGERLGTELADGRA